ncbi:MAG: hypothetical protein U0234_08650 [Sandaracinus sp.]
MTDSADPVSTLRDVVMRRRSDDGRALRADDTRRLLAALEAVRVARSVDALPWIVELEDSASSCRALVEVLAPHVADGNVRVLVTWYGEEHEEPERVPAKRLGDLTSELAPFPKGVIFDVTP